VPLTLRLLGDLPLCHANRDGDRQSSPQHRTYLALDQNLLHTSDAVPHSNHNISCGRFTKVYKTGTLGAVQSLGKTMIANKIDFNKINVNPEGKGTFGFTNFAEIWNGRLAMIGFVAALVNEVITGKGILGQVGISREGGILVALFLVGFSIAATIGYYTIKFSLPAQEPRTGVGRNAS
jgi:hypothetical protein